MGVKMTRFNMTKNMEDYKVTLDKVSMAAKWDENIKFAWFCRAQQHVVNCSRSR